MYTDDGLGDFDRQGREMRVQMRMANTARAN